MQIPFWPRRRRNPVVLESYSFPSGHSPVASQVTTTGTEDSRLGHEQWVNLEYTYDNLSTAYNNVGLAQQIVDIPVMDALAVPPTYRGVLKDKDVYLNRLLAFAGINARIFGLVFILAIPDGEASEFVESEMASLSALRSVSIDFGLNFKLFLFANKSKDENGVWAWNIGGKRVPLDRVFPLFGHMPPLSLTDLNVQYAGLVDMTSQPIPGTSALLPMLPLIYEERELGAAMADGAQQNNLLHIAKDGFIGGLNDDLVVSDGKFLVPNGRGVLVTSRFTEAKRLGTMLESYPSMMEAQTTRVCRDAGIPEGRLSSITSTGWSSTGESDQDVYTLMVSSSVQGGMFRPLLNWVQTSLGGPANEEQFTFHPLIPRVDEGDDDDSTGSGTDSRNVAV